MSEYIPPTVAVREAYGYTCHDSYLEGNREAKRQEFDRWLAAYDADVRKAALEDELGAIAGLLRGTYSDEPDGHGSGVSPITVALAHIESRLSAIRAAALGDAPTGGE